MKGIDDPLAEMLIRSKPQDLLCRRTGIEQFGIGIDEHNGVRAFFDQGAKTFLAGAKRLLCLFILGDVREHPVESENFFRTVAASPNTVANPAQGAVLAINSVFLFLTNRLTALDSQDSFVK